jgi:hypothetical protein
MNYSNNENHTGEEEKEKHQKDSEKKQGESRPIEKSDGLYSEYLNAFCPEY